jgi:hypothetical protein
MATNTGIWMLALVTWCAGCASSATNLDPKELPPDEGAVIGRVRIFHKKEEVTSYCYVEFVDAAGDRKARVSLDETGEIAISMKQGPTLFGVVNCHEDPSFQPEPLEFTVFGHGETTYFGSVRLSVEADAPSKYWLMLGAIGTAVATSGGALPSYASVSNDHIRAARQYVQRYGESPRLRVSLAGGDRRPPAPESEPQVVRRGDGFRAEANSNGVRVVWLAEPRNGESGFGFALERQVAGRSLSNCKTIVFEIDGKRVETSLAYQSKAGPKGTRETLQARLDADSLASIARARAVDIEVCGFERRLSTNGLIAARKLLEASSTLEAGMQTAAAPAAPAESSPTMPPSSPPPTPAEPSAP